MSESKSELKPWPEFVGKEQRAWVRVLLRFEWICEQISYRLSRWAFIDVLEYIGKLGVLGAVVLWFYPGCKQREIAREDAQRTKHYIAWQTLNSAVGVSGDAGRSLAITDLLADDVSLNGINLDGATLPYSSITLTNDEIEYIGQNFFRADLDYSSLRMMDLTGADFYKASLVSADLEKSVFSYCSFSKTKFERAHLENASLMWCNFSDLRFQNTIMTNANFHHSSFSNLTMNCDVANTDFSETYFVQCSLQGLKNWEMAKWSNAVFVRTARAPQGFLEWVANHGGVVTTNAIR